TVVASLKSLPRPGPHHPPGRFPRLHSRGLIEVTCMSLTPAPAKEFPRLHSRGLIEVLPTDLPETSRCRFHDCTVVASLKYGRVGHDVRDRLGFHDCT